MADGSFAILLYHGLDDGRPFAGEADPHRKEYVLSVERFEAHLEALRVGRSRVALLEVCVAAGAGRQAEDAVALTFDDGEESCHRLVAPLLERRGFRGDFFIVSRLVGTPGYMTAAQIRELADRGHGIHSHSASHGFLTTMNRRAIHEEVAGSKAAIEAIAGRPVRFFSCPRGSCNDLVLEVAWEAGYERVLTSVEGYNRAGSALRVLKRFAMRSYTTAASLRRICGHRAATSCRLAAKRLALRTVKAVVPFERYDRWRTRAMARAGLLT